MYSLLVLSVILAAGHLSSYGEAKRTFEIDYMNDQFLKDGQPYRYIAGEIHYFRIHYTLWNDRLQRYRAAGLNAVQVYVPWNYHEPTPGVFNFAYDYRQDNRNLTEFILLAQKNELDVLLRIGPYACAEWENGGLPWWLSSIPGIKLRTADEKYLSAVRRYFDALLTIVEPLLHKNGGPVLMIQIENEYGSIGVADKKYMRFLRDEVRGKLGNDTVLYTTDGCGEDMVRHGSIDGVYPTVDFGPYYGAAGPLVNSEFYPGWFEQWGGSVPSAPVDSMMKAIEQMWALNASFSIYMFHGGTNFGFWNGAEVWDPKHGTAPIATTYDYAAPISEAGDIRDSYLRIRQFIQTLPNWPNPPKSVPHNHSSFHLSVPTEISGSLLWEFREYAPPILCPSSRDPLSFEDIGHAYGYASYATILMFDGSQLTIGNLRDAAYVYLDGEYQGYLQCCFNASLTLTTNATKALDLGIIVENQGRLNFPIGPGTRDFKGMSNVTLDGREVTGWSNCGVNWDLFEASVKRRLREGKKALGSAGKRINPNEPALHVADFDLEHSDTHLHSFWDTTGWGKGQISLNDFNLGRYWPNRGPQTTLYVPGGVFAKSNIALIVELVGCQKCKFLNFVGEPISRVAGNVTATQALPGGRWDTTHT